MNQLRKHDRKPMRLKGYDYSQDGLYFITICTKNREHIFGDIKNGKTILNEYGDIVSNYWNEIPNHYKNVELDEYIIMPDHFHGIIRLNPPHTAAVTIGAVVRSFKARCTHAINKITKNIGVKIWQRNYYEHIIRNEKSYYWISEYIKSNPENWQDDNICI